MNRPNFWNFKNNRKKIEQLYSDPANLVVFEFANRTEVTKFIWVEPTCVSIETDANTEYQIVSHDKTFRVEFDTNETLIFYLQYSFGFILNKRAISTMIPNPNSWILDFDYADIS